MKILRIIVHSPAAESEENMDSFFDKFLNAIGKIIFGLIIISVLAINMIQVHGPGADRWFAEHPVVHFLYQLIHFI